MQPQTTNGEKEKDQRFSNVIVGLEVSFSNLETFHLIHIFFIIKY